ncbi:MAG: hypothetical protein EOO51_12610 [Flavobacterium sp.]|nr:MAG: hypothetical protein EOO51_12610 [Flavobacterium sp.]
MITTTSVTQDSDNIVVTDALAKLHLRVDGTDEDQLISLYLASAQSVVENRTGRAVGLQRFVLNLDCFDAVTFGKSSNDAIEKVEYYPAAGNELVELSDDSLFSMIDCGPDSLNLSFNGDLPAIAKRDDAIKVTIRRGYAIADCPTPIKNAMLLLIGDSYERREDRGDVGYNSQVDSLLRPYRKW